MSEDDKELFAILRIGEIDNEDRLRDEYIFDCKNEYDVEPTPEGFEKYKVMRTESKESEKIQRAEAEQRLLRIKNGTASRDDLFIHELQNM